MMNLLCFLLLLLATLFASVSPALWNQAWMMYRILGVNPLHYIKYGCYCGPGTGDIDDPPIDGIDTCCYYHDHCYAATTRICKNIFWKFATDYSWSFSRRTKELKCTSWSWRTCARALCNCDVQAAKCFAYYTRLRGEKKNCTVNEYAKIWNATNKHHPFEPWHNQSKYTHYITNGESLLSPQIFL